MLFFSRTVKFASLGVAALARTGGVAVTSPGGDALVVGGAEQEAASIVEHFDPRTGVLAELARLASRTGTTATLIGAGPQARLAVVGGTGPGLLELVDLEAGAPRVERIDDARLARVEMTATTLTDGRVVVIGGEGPGGQPLAEVIELAPIAGSTEVRALRAGLATPRAGHTATRLGDDVGAPVLVAGGRASDGRPAATAELFKPLSGDFARTTTFAPVMLVPRRAHVARLLPDGSVLFIGGLDADGAPITSLERFTIDAGFVPAGELPPGAGVLDVAATTLPDGRIHLSGGRLADGGAALDAAFIVRLDPIGGTVDIVATDRLAWPRAGHQATVLCDGTVLIAGGTASPTIVERYNPPAAGRR